MNSHKNGVLPNHFGWNGCRLYTGEPVQVSFAWRNAAAVPFSSMRGGDFMMGFSENGVYNIK